MKVIVRSIVVGAFETVSKDLEKRMVELKIRRISTIQIMAQLRSVRYFEKSWIPEETSYLQYSPPKKKQKNKKNV